MTDNDVDRADRPSRPAAFLEEALGLCWLASALAAVVGGFVLVVQDTPYVEGLALVLAGMAAMAGGGYIWPNPLDDEIQAARRGEQAAVASGPLWMRLGRGIEKAAVALVVLLLDAVGVLAYDAWATTILGLLAVLSVVVALGE